MLVFEIMLYSGLILYINFMCLMHDTYIHRRCCVWSYIENIMCSQKVSLLQWKWTVLAYFFSHLVFDSLVEMLRFMSGQRACPSELDSVSE